MRKNVKKSLNEYDLDSQYLFYEKYFNEFIAVINFSSEFAPKIIRLFLLEYAFKLEIFFCYLCKSVSSHKVCLAQSFASFIIHQHAQFLQIVCSLLSCFAEIFLFVFLSLKLFFSRRLKRCGGLAF